MLKMQLEEILKSSTQSKQNLDEFQCPLCEGFHGNNSKCQEGE